MEGDVRVTYSEWVRRADSLAATLAERGVGPGDVVALYLATSIDYAVGYAAASRLGAVATGINTRLGPTEISAILGRCEPAVLIHESAGDPVPVGVTRPGVVMARDEMQRAAGAGKEFTPPVSVRPEDPACIVWTSGTTGTPKGAWFDHRRCGRRRR